MKNLSLVLFSSFLITFSGSCQNDTGSAAGGKLEAAAFSEKIKAETEEVVLDVRTPGEFSEGKIEGAVNFNYNDPAFKDEIAKLDKNKTYFVYCLAGGRSSAAADQMRAGGFKNVYDLKGGMMAWKAANLPVSVTSGTNVSADKISMEDFKKMTTDTIPVLIDFYAPWCGPCKKMKPMLEEIQKENPKTVKVIRINIDENKNLAGELKVTELPVVMVYKNGERSLRHDGFADKNKLIDMLK